ncbi:MAG: TolC family protein [Bacteroidetes bacterium]|nr:TolC family protein [Bacteroidota bacterium]
MRNLNPQSVITGLFFLMVGISSALPAQDTLTLDFCYQQVDETYPLARQKELLSKSSELREKNITKNWLPQVNINGNASLQSDVTSISLDLPTGFPQIRVPSPARDQYKLTLDVNQAVYEGNATRYQKRLEDYNLRSDQKNLQVQLYQLKEQINQFYFSILLFQKNEALLVSSKDVIEAKLKEVKSSVENGTQLASNADALEVQILLLDQQIAGIKADRSATLKMLSEIISKPVSEQAILAIPKVTIGNYTFENKRFENEFYDIQQQKTDVLKNLVTTKWNPKFFAFGELGYGRPGFNMLSNDFTSFWMFGGKLTWNIWNWNQNKNEKKVYDIQKDLIQTQKESFDKNTRIAAEKNLAEIVKLADMLLKDDQIINLRTKITKTASSQMDNGVITSSDYVNRMNEEIQAKQNMELHKIQLIKAKIAYLFTTGKL